MINTFSLNKKIRIKCCNKIMFFNPDDIIYITKDGRYSIIKTKKKDYLCSKPLKYFESEFEKYKIIRVHKSYLINFNYVDYIKKENYRNIKLYIKKYDLQIKVGGKYLDKIKNSRIYNLNSHIHNIKS
ncbi:MAG: LytTR family transcriptional regulator [Candidatus Mcinerneyibacterium aminivorans]|uniref:LytTR family transcriptional regulator n=1 Tax=Candidatus Mcinerneyibacterium aminivorans TaxID=2703815 RepID=A0A5D0MFV4_9BACT|nr:MAG: LytTR family transcriptional regulator [Candidatus Mcinerneyibacterium aminivorans]